MILCKREGGPLRAGQFSTADLVCGCRTRCHGDWAHAPALGAGCGQPTLFGPLAQTGARGALVWDVAGLGYHAAEYILSGVADVYSPVSMADALDVASRDSVKDLGARTFSREVLSANQSFKTRLIVYRPEDARRFSGMVICGAAAGALHIVPIRGRQVLQCVLQRRRRTLTCGALGFQQKFFQAHRYRFGNQFLLGTEVATEGAMSQSRRRHDFVAI